MFQYFYNETLRKLTLAFGGLFDEIYIAKPSASGQTQKIRVPLTYSGKEKFVRRITEASSISNNVKIESLVPRLGFEMTTMQYDPSRKINKTNKRIKVIENSDESTTTYSSYSEVPYNIQFGLYCFTRNVDDNLQIIEQIIPYFSPEFVVTLKMNNLDTQVDVPIILNGVNFAEVSEGDMLIRRNLITTLSFTAKAHIFALVNDNTSGLIKEADVNIFEDDTL